MKTQLFALLDAGHFQVAKGGSIQRANQHPILNIKQWHNFSAYGDVVCHDSTLEDDFFSDMKKYVKAYKTGELMDYTKLFNPFITSEGKKNPHKSYGYLIQPKLSQKIIEFMS